MTKPRKGKKHASDFAILLRDAQPIWREIEGEHDLRQRRLNERARDIAIDELVTIYSDYQEQGRLYELPHDVIIFCEQLKAKNGGKFPSRKGGRPTDDHKKLWIAVRVAEALEAQTGKRKSVTKAVREVHNNLVLNGKRCTVPQATIRDYYYDSDLQRAIKVELACRKADDVCEPSGNCRS